MAILTKTSRRILMFVGLFIGLLAAPAVTSAQNIVAILTCPMGCGVMEGNTVFGTMMAKAGEKLIVAAQETPGYMYNVRAMQEKRRWKKQVFGTEDVIIQLALQD